MKPAAVTRYFDETADDYLSAHARVTDLLFTVAHGNVLDTGCGPGVYAGWLAQRGCTVYGVDRSETMVSLAKQQAAPNARYLVAGVDRLRRVASMVVGWCRLPPGCAQ